MRSGGAELIVLGGGPAGVGAATAAAACGTDVLLIDENYASGGQVYRPMPPGFRAKPRRPAHASIGALQAEKLGQSGVRTAFNHLVWSVAPGYRVEAAGPDGLSHWTAPALVAATGCHERVIPFPGWTIPGVIGLAAATILLKSQGMLPGRRTLVAGCGPLLAAVAAGVLKAGGEVAAVVDLASLADWARTLPAIASRPDLGWQGTRWLAGIVSARTPIYRRHTIERVEENDKGLAAFLRPVDAAGRPAAGGAGTIVTADAVAVGHGLVPATEVTRLLCAKHDFFAAEGGWIAAHDADFRTSLPGLYIAGDGAGIAGADAAFLRGQVCGLAAARELGRIDPAEHGRRVLPLRRSLARAERFGKAMSKLMMARSAQVESIHAETVVCRCEDVPRAEIDQAIDAGAREVNQLKAWSRCGMGPCQGRMCGEAVSSILAARVGGRENAGYFTGRMPLRPLPLATITGDFEYADIPLPAAAPL
jgi:NADPH-dependent 2,4-dienoyl-CoA reductase/sulfur reductase-like enzyme